MFKDLIRHINLIISNLLLDRNEQKFLEFNQKNFKEKKNLKKKIYTYTSCYRLLLPSLL